MTLFQHRLVFAAITACTLAMVLAWTWWMVGVALDINATDDDAAAVAILKTDESFRGMPYPDAGGQAIGYGTDLPITTNEGALLLRHRLEANWQGVVQHWPGANALPDAILAPLMAAAYQLGPEGLLGFTDMRGAIDREDWHAAADAALDSEWARETPHRARELADALRAL